MSQEPKEKFQKVVLFLLDKLRPNLNRIATSVDILCRYFRVDHLAKEKQKKAIEELGFKELVLFMRELSSDFIRMGNNLLSRNDKRLHFSEIDRKLVVGITTGEQYERLLVALCGQLAEPMERLESHCKLINENYCSVELEEASGESASGKAVIYEVLKQAERLADNLNKLDLYILVKYHKPDEDMVNRFANLEALLAAEFITKADFRERRDGLLEELVEERLSRPAAEEDALDPLALSFSKELAETRTSAYYKTDSSLREGDSVDPLIKQIEEAVIVEEYDPEAEAEAAKLKQLKLEMLKEKEAARQQALHKLQPHYSDKPSRSQPDLQHDEEEETTDEAEEETTSTTTAAVVTSSSKGQVSATVVKSNSSQSDEHGAVGDRWDEELLAELDADLNKPATPLAAPASSHSPPPSSSLTLDDSVDLDATLEEVLFELENPEASSTAVAPSKTAAKPTTKPPNNKFKELNIKIIKPATYSKKPSSSPSSSFKTTSTTTTTTTASTSASSGSGKTSGKTLEVGTFIKKEPLKAPQDTLEKELGASLSRNKKPFSLSVQLNKPLTVPKGTLLISVVLDNQSSRPINSIRLELVDGQTPVFVVEDATGDNYFKFFPLAEAKFEGQLIFKLPEKIGLGDYQLKVLADFTKDVKSPKKKVKSSDRLGVTVPLQLVDPLVSWKLNPHQIFGVALETLYSRDGTTVVPLLIDAINYVKEKVHFEGIFRKSGNQHIVAVYKEMLDAGLSLPLTTEKNVHNIAGVLKLWIRNLPEPLIPASFYDKFVSVTKKHSKAPEKAAEEYNLMIPSIPEENKIVLRVFMEFFSFVASHSDKNKMAPKNIAIIMGPIVLWKPDLAPMDTIQNTAAVNQCTQTLIESNSFL